MSFIGNNAYFKNPLKLPLNQVHLEMKVLKQIKELPKDVTAQDIETLDMKEYYQPKCEVIPAIDKEWISDNFGFHQYIPYNFDFPLEENKEFLEKCELFNRDLERLLKCNYHRFWCNIILEDELTNNIANYILKPIYWYELDYVDCEHFHTYVMVYNNILKVYKRLLKFQESDVEFMRQDTIMEHLLEKKLISVPIIVSLTLLYGQRHPEFIHELISGFLIKKRESLFNCQMRNVLKRALVILEMAGGYICGFDEAADIIEMDVKPKPNGFDPYWYNETLTLVLEALASLHAFFSFHKPAMDMAIELGLPYRMTYFYDRVFPKIHQTLNSKWELPYNWDYLRDRLYATLYKCRVRFIKGFDVIVTYIVDNVLLHVGDIDNQMRYVEQFLKLITTAMEDENFFFDYHVENPIHLQIENVAELCPYVDKTQTDFITDSIRKSFGFAVKKDASAQTFFSMEDFIDPKEKRKLREQLWKENEVVSVEVQKNVNEELNSEVIESAIQIVQSALPHLGDGFILKCLEYYDYNPTEVITAILDGNLAPHLLEVSFTMIRIPPEPEPPKPIVEHKGKKPHEFENANDFLDDKSGLSSEIRELIISTNRDRYLYDDDYDDAADEPAGVDYAMLGRDGTGDNNLKAQEDEKLVSDPEITSEEEYDEDGKPIAKTVSKKNEQGDVKKDAFCEDPAVIRARREQQRKNLGRGSQHNKRNDLVGKPKGQGQDKDVQQNRSKKNVNKSSWSNHNRKGGAQFKRSRGMLPS